MPTWHFSKPRIPASALLLSAAALAVPIAAAFVADQAPAVSMLWLVALIPLIVLAYYRGWQGTAIAVTAAMGSFALSSVLLILRGSTVDVVLLFAIFASYMAVCIAVGWLAEAVHAQRARAELIALTDELTGLPNRRCIRMFLDRRWAGRRGTLAVVLFDLDNFKLFNDEHGHLAGDVMLRTFAHVLRDLIPDHSMASRYGGEEFLAVLSECDEAAAAAFAERIRLALRGQQLGNTPLTVSAGVAAGGFGGSSVTDLIVAADRALYRAKQDGRDCVRSAAGLIPAPP